MSVAYPIINGVITVASVGLLLFMCRPVGRGAFLRMPVVSTEKLATRNKNGPRSSLAAWPWHNASFLYESHWFGAFGPVVLLLYRIFILLFWLFGTLFESLAPLELSLGLYEEYMTYFTNWSWWLLLVHAVVGSVISLRGIIGRESKDSASDLLASKIKVYDWLDKVHAALTATLLPISLFITVAYWGGVHSPGDKIYLDSLFKHGINCFVLLGEMVISRVPMTSVWLVFPALWALIYATFMWIYWALSEDWVYARLDWTEASHIAVYVGAIVFLVLTFWTMFGLVYLRERIAGRRRGETALSSSGDSQNV